MNVTAELLPLLDLLTVRLCRAAHLPLPVAGALSGGPFVLADRSVFEQELGMTLQRLYGDPRPFGEALHGLVGDYHDLLMQASPAWLEAAGRQVPVREVREALTLPPLLGRALRADYPLPEAVVQRTVRAPMTHLALWLTEPRQPAPDAFLEDLLAGRRLTVADADSLRLTALGAVCELPDEPQESGVLLHELLWLLWLSLQLAATLDHDFPQDGPGRYPLRNVVTPVVDALELLLSLDRVTLKSSAAHPDHDLLEDLLEAACNT
jgi:hypothetical protein